MSSIPRMSLVSQFDDLRRYTSVMTAGCEEEFKIFVINQKQMIHKWKQSELEVQSLRSTISQLRNERTRFEAQLKHLRDALESEGAKRQRIEMEKKSMERQLTLIKDVLLADGGTIDNQTRERLFFLSNPSDKAKNESPIKLTTIEESCDLLSASDFDETEDGDFLFLEGSRKRRSKGKRRSSGERHIQKRKKSDVMESLQEELQLPELDFENICQDTNLNYRRSSSEPTTVDPQQLPPQRPQLRSDSEQFRRTYDRNCGVFSGIGSKPMGRCSTGSKLSRSHAFCIKTIIKTEKCNPCNKQIGFCSKYLKCQDCRIVCHIECKEKCPLPCIPVPPTPPKIITGTITDYTSNVAPMIPSLIVHCVNEINYRGLKEIGLYRVSGSERDVKDLKEKLLKLKQKSVPSLNGVDIHAICGTVKEFLRSLKDPLITRAAWKTFVDAAENRNEDVSYNMLYNAVLKLPQPNKETLAFLIMHLQKVADSPECKMPIENLATVFGPTIVGYSVPYPADDALLKETNYQKRVVHRLLMIPSGSWQNILNVEPSDIFNTNIKTPESIPAPITSRLGPIYSSSSKHQTVKIGKTPLTPRNTRKNTQTIPKRQYFQSPLLK